MDACHDVVKAGHSIEDPGALKRPADTEYGNLMSGQMGDVNGIEANSTGGGWYEARNQVEECGLAGAIRAYEAVDFSFLDLYVQHVDGAQADEVLGQPSSREQSMKSFPIPRASRIVLWSSCIIGASNTAIFQ